jgi:phosphoglycolate phosphatase
MPDPFPALLVFDLDGTLIDSQADISNSVNATLEHFGKPRLPDTIIRSYIGDGASMLIRRALGDPEGDATDEAFVAAGLQFFLDYYRVHKLDYTYVYPGVVEALQTIRDRYPSLPMAVLTNKPVIPSRAICEHFGLDRFFFQNYGGNSFHTKKPDPHGLLALIAEASSLTGHPVPPHATVMVGDSHVDILTARACGARSIGCTFGLAPDSLPAAEPDQLAHSPHEWPALLAQLA